MFDKRKALSLGTMLGGGRQRLSEKAMEALLSDSAKYSWSSERLVANSLAQSGATLRSEWMSRTGW